MRKRNMLNGWWRWRRSLVARLKTAVRCPVVRLSAVRRSSAHTHTDTRTRTHLHTLSTRTQKCMCMQTKPRPLFNVLQFQEFRKRNVRNFVFVIFFSLHFISRYDADLWLPAPPLSPSPTGGVYVSNVQVSWLCSGADSLAIKNGLFLGFWVRFREYPLGFLDPKLGKPKSCRMYPR